MDIAVRSLTPHTATGTHMPYRITHCYLPPDIRFVGNTLKYVASNDISIGSSVFVRAVLRCADQYHRFGDAELHLAHLAGPLSAAVPSHDLHLTTNDHQNAPVAEDDDSSTVDPAACTSCQDAAISAACKCLFSRQFRPWQISRLYCTSKDHARPGRTTSRRGQDSPWKSQSE